VSRNSVAQQNRSPAEGRSRDADNEVERHVESAYSTLLARLAPDTTVRRVRWSQGETQVLELGAGPPLLYVHGGLGGAFEAVPLLPALAQNHSVFVVDRPGHGLADPFDYSREDLLDHARTFVGDILDALKLPVVDIVANSMGGLWSVVLALDVPDRVSRLVIVGAPPGVTRDVPLQLRILGLPLVGRPLGRLLMSKPTRDGNRRFWGKILVAHPELLDDSLLDADVASQRRNLDSHLSLLRVVLNAGGLRPELVLGERWQQLRVPTLFLCGERDAFVTTRARKTWEDIAARNPHIRVIDVPDAGHLPWLDNPERVIGEIEDFLETRSPVV
jgi:pimeloyl-ACP methyl ester carboxylesterase